MIRTDVLVVGAGMAGLSVAAALEARGGHRFAVASAGTWPHEPDSGEPARVDTATGAPWSTRNGNYLPLPGLVPRIGGRSLCWQGIVLPIEPGALAHWPQETAARLTGQGGSYAAATARLERWRGAPLDEPTCPGDTKVRLALAEAGWAFDVVPKAAVSRLTPAGRTWRAYTPLDDLTGDRPAWLLPGHTALTVEPAAAGFRTVFRTDAGGIAVVESASVVLAAGTLETTRLFAQAEAATRPRRSAERWPDLCAKIKHGVTAAAPPSLAAVLRPDDHVFLTTAAPELAALLFLELHADRHGVPTLDLWWQAEQTPTERGAIHFAAHGRVWPGAVEAEVGPRDAQLTALRDQAARDLLDALECRRPADSGGPPHPDGAAACEHTALTGETARYAPRLGSGQHESGTVALGRHLDAGFMARRIEGLFVCGPATFPRSGAANPALTILATADLVAENAHRYVASLHP